MFSDLFSSLTIVLLGALNIHSFTISAFFLIVTYDLQVRLTMDFTYAYIIFDLLSVFFLFNFNKYYWTVPVLYCGYNVYDLVLQDYSTYFVGNCGIGVLGLLLGINKKYKSAVFGIAYTLVCLWAYLDPNVGKPPVLFTRAIWYYVIRADHSKKMVSKTKASKRLSLRKSKPAKNSSSTISKDFEITSNDLPQPDIPETETSAASIPSATMADGGSQSIENQQSSDELN
ncbi:hypothetical protein HDV01_007374 [Terramyces sp. JEL0728]|nr:hypothetical protein HDV01_007374 [Terramyces sp. JEL0728]